MPTTAPAPDPAITKRIWDILGQDPNDPRFQKQIEYRDSDGSGSGQMIANSAYDPELDAARQWLVDNNYVQQTGGNSGEGNTANAYQWGAGAPGAKSMAGYTLTGDTPAEAARFVSTQQMKGNGQTAINPDLVGDSPIYGQMTMQGNVKQPKSPWDTFWKVAPMLPAAFAAVMSGGALAPLLASMPEAGGTAANMGLLGLDAAPGWAEGLGLDKLVKGGISALNSNDGKFNPLAFLGPVLGAAGVPGSAISLGQLGLGAMQGKKVNPMGTAMTLGRLGSGALEG